MIQTEHDKLVGFGQSIYGWKWDDAPVRNFKSGEVVRLTAPQFWSLKTFWPQAVYDLSLSGTIQ